MTMRARSLELNLVNTEAVGAADIDGRNRALRALDLLPTGGRGPHPPNISPQHAAYLFLRFGSASGEADPGGAAKRYAPFVNPGAPDKISARRSSLGRARVGRLARQPQSRQRR